MDLKQFLIAQQLENSINSKDLFLSDATTDFVWLQKYEPNMNLGMLHHSWIGYTDYVERALTKHNCPTWFRGGDTRWCLLYR